MSQTFGRYFLNHIPMFYDFTVFHSEQIVKCVFFTPFHSPSLTVRTKFPSPKTLWILVYLNTIVLKVRYSTEFHNSVQSIFNLWVVLVVLFCTYVLCSYFILDFYPFKMSLIKEVTKALLASVLSKSSTVVGPSV
jgi:hypothetical protein